MLTVKILSTIVALSFRTKKNNSRNSPEEMKELNKVESETNFWKVRIKMIMPNTYLKRLLFRLNLGMTWWCGIEKYAYDNVLSVRKKWKIINRFEIFKWMWELWIFRRWYVLYETEESQSQFMCVCRCLWLAPQFVGPNRYFAAWNK